MYLFYLCSNSIGYDNPDFGIRRYLQLNDVNIVTDDIFTSNLASKCSVFIIKFYNDVVLTSMRRNHVASTLIRCHRIDVDAT